MSEEELKHISESLGQGISFRARTIRKLIEEIKRLKKEMKPKEKLIFSNRLGVAA